MVVINGIKYACDRCIRGHRVSGCRHVKQPLKMIKRKGRPPSQCATCKKIRPKGNSGLAPCSCGDSSESQSPDANYRGEFDFHGQALKPASYGNDIQPKSELTPEELSKLRQQPNVKIELPDGTILGPESESSSEPGSDLFASPSSAYHAHRSITSSGDDDYVSPDRFRYQPHILGKLPGPYNAELYNDSLGNNEAAAVMNARGDCGYAPNTGSVAFQPRMVLENELASSNQELAESLSGIPEVKPHINLAASRPDDPEHFSEAAVDPYAPEAQISKLSNLY